MNDDATSNVLLDEGPVFPVEGRQGFVVLEFAERPENVLEGKGLLIAERVSSQLIFLKVILFLQEKTPTKEPHVT